MISKVIRLSEKLIYLSPEELGNDYKKWHPKHNHRKRHSATIVIGILCVSVIIRSWIATATYLLVYWHITHARVAPNAYLEALIMIYQIKKNSFFR